jgi:hypothetical protein
MWFNVLRLGKAHYRAIADRWEERCTSIWGCRKVPALTVFDPHDAAGMNLRRGVFEEDKEQEVPLSDMPV